MNEPKFGPTEFQAEIERLRSAGKMLSLEDVLSVIADVREEYVPLILKARKKARVKIAARPCVYGKFRQD